MLRRNMFVGYGFGAGYPSEFGKLYGRGTLDGGDNDGGGESN